MKVHELMEYLEQLDQNADVLAVVQPNWPFECRVSRVLVRDPSGPERENLLETGSPADLRDWILSNAEDMDQDEIDALHHESLESLQDIVRKWNQPSEARSRDTWQNDGNPNDVLLLITDQLRYADKKLYDRED